MEKIIKIIKIEGHKEMLIRFQSAVKAMTQEQCDSCTWLMGGHGDCWTPASLAGAYQEIIKEMG